MSIPVAASFQCPPDCGRCCSDLSREVAHEEAAGAREWRGMLRELGVYHCSDAPATGLTLTWAEADALLDEAARRGMRVQLHPRVWLLEPRRRVAVALQWHLAHASCPFYADYKCTVYDLRPLVCRAFPVMRTAPSWRLSPSCPKSEETSAAAASGEATLGIFLRREGHARRALERALSDLDDRAMRLVDTPGSRFAKGLDAREALRRLKRYRLVSPEEFEESCTVRGKS